MTYLDLTNPCILLCLFIVGFPVVLIVLYPLCTWRSRSIAIRVMAVLMGLILLLGAGSYTYLLMGTSQGERQLRTMLSGDESIRFSRLVIQGQQRQVLCSDPAVLRYVERCSRGHIPCPKDRVMGWSYHVILEFQNGGYTDLWGTFNDNIFDTHVGVPRDVGWPTHYIPFPEPMPERMKQILDYIAVPHERLGGRKLVVDPDGVKLLDGR
jgi:hypothetical protein